MVCQMVILLPLNLGNHRSKSCYLKYIKLQKLDVKQPEGSEKQAVKVAVGKLISEFQTPIIDDNQVFLLTSLKKRFLELLKEGVEGANEYRSERLKKQLSNEWQDISFIPQPGMSDFVCSLAPVFHCLLAASHLTSVA